MRDRTQRRIADEAVLAANEADAEAVKWQLQLRLASLEDDAGRPVLRPYRRTGRRALVHRAPPRRGRRRRAGGRRLASRGRDTVLPGDARRSVRAPLAPAVRFHRPRAARRLRRGLRRPRLARRIRRRARPAARRARPGPHRPDARHRRDDPGRAGRDHPRPARTLPRRAGRSGHRARPRSACTAPRSCSTSTARCCRARACSSSVRTPCSCATSARCSRRSARRPRRRRRSTGCSSLRFRVRGEDPDAVAAVKGDARMATVIARAANQMIKLPAEGLTLAYRARRIAPDARRPRTSSSPKRNAERCPSRRSGSGSATRSCAPRTRSSRAASSSGPTSRSGAPSCSPTPRTARRSTAAGAR